MPDQTNRIGMPYMASAQAQKELVHNEAITLADLVIQPVVQEIGLNAPPLSPDEGACWVVGNSPSGAWLSHAGDIAGWTSGGWRFVAPRNGFSVWSIADSKSARYSDGQWVLGVTNATQYQVNGLHVVKERQPIIPDPFGGATIDAEGRIALVSILQTLRTHGLIAI
jgi:Protein of unknown function (DUF2793)